MSDDAIGFSGLKKLASEYKSEPSHVKGMDEHNRFAQNDLDTLSSSPESRADAASAESREPMVDETGVLQNESASESAQDPCGAMEEIDSISSVPDDTVPLLESPRLSRSIEGQQEDLATPVNEAPIGATQQSVSPLSASEECVEPKESSAPELPNEERSPISSPKDVVKSSGRIGKEVRPTPKGIEGLLYFFCFLLVMVSPLAFFAASGFLLITFQSPGYHDLVSNNILLFSRLQFALSLFVVLSVLSGYIIYFGSKHGRKVAVLYLITFVGLGLWPLVGTTDDFSLDSYYSIYQSFSEYVISVFSWAAFWLLYFFLSRRARNNYSYSYSTPIRESPVAKSSYVILPVWVILVILLQVPSVINIFTYQHIIPLQAWQAHVKEIAMSLLNEKQYGIVSGGDDYATIDVPAIQAEESKSRNESPAVISTIDSKGDRQIGEPDSLAILSTRTHPIAIGTTILVVPEPPAAIMQSGITSDNKYYHIRLGFLQRDDTQNLLIAHAFSIVNGMEDRFFDEKIFASYRDWLMKKYRQIPQSIEILENRSRVITFSYLSDTALNQQPAKRRTTESFAILKNKLYRLVVHVIYGHGVEPPDGFEVSLAWRISIVRANLGTLGEESKHQSNMIAPSSFSFSRSLVNAMHMPSRAMFHSAFIASKE